MKLDRHSLGEICDKVGGIIRTGPFGSQLHESDYKEEGIPVVMPKNIVDGKISTEGIARISDDDVARLAQHKLHRGDIVYGRRGDIGRRALIAAKEDGWICGTGCLHISLGNTLLYPLFLYYFLGQPRVIKWICNQAIGATLPNLNTEIIRSTQILYPSLLTQRKIAAILSAYDDLIENNKRRIAILEEMAQSLYSEWFVYFRFPGHEKKRLVESELGLIPEGWEVVKLRDVSSLINRGISPKYDNASENLVINQRCIRHGKLNLDETRRHLTRVSNEKLVRFGDVLVNSTGIGTLGRVAQIYRDIPNCTVDSHVTIVRPRDRAIIDYFGYYLQSLQPLFDSLGVGSTGQTELSRESIASSNFLLPPNNVQEAFAIFVSPMRRNVIQMLTKNANLRQTRDLLLPKLISGEVDVEGLEIHIEGGTYESDSNKLPEISSRNETVHYSDLSAHVLCGRHLLAHEST